MPLTRIFLKFKGIFDLGGLLNVITDWFETRGYTVVIDQVKHKLKTQGYEDEYQITGWRDETDFHRIKIRFSMYMWEGNLVEVVVGGQQRKLMKARINICLEGDLEYDFQGRYDKSMFAKGLRTFLLNQVLKHRYGTIWEDHLHYKVHEVGNNIKEYLDMQSKGKYYKNMW